MALFRNPYVLAFAALYALSVVVLAGSGVYSPAEPLFMLAIFGLLLPGVAYALCRKCTSLDVRAGTSRREIGLTIALLFFVTFYLVWGSERLDALIDGGLDLSPRSAFFLDIIKKLLIFVAIPYLVLSRTLGYGWRDFGFARNVRSALAPPFLRIVAVFFVLYLAIQLFVGQAAQPLFQGEFSITAVMIGGTLLYVLQIMEVGLVEEFFFRAVLQTRLAAWLGSEPAGLFTMALIFGLAHAPGLYLREAGTVTALGATPGLASAIAYSIAVLSLAGLAFGVIWAMTRIYVLILIHAWVDTLPGLPAFIEMFNLQ